MIALSTCWRSRSGLGGRALVDLIRGLGFEEIEVEYRLSREQLGEIQTSVSSGLIRVGSVHNFVPLIPGESHSSDGGDRFLLSSVDESERRRAVEKTKRTLRVAWELGAKVVILHLGRVEIETNSRLLPAMVREGQGDSEDARVLRTKMRQEREKGAAPHVDRVLRSVQDLQSTAGELGLCLGLENRYYYDQIPDPDELATLLEATDPGIVRYWHDIGHAQVMQNIGMRNHSEYLERAGARLLGMHLHDIIGATDHLAPGTGAFDFESLRPWWRPDLLMVMELRPSVTEEQVVSGREYLERITDST